MGKVNMKWLVALIMSVSLVFGVTGCGSGSVSSPEVSSSQESSTVKVQNEVSVTVTDKQATNEGKVAIKQGDTALVALEKYAKENNISLVKTGTGSSAYVTKIGNTESDKHTGWMFSVNGKSPKVGAGVYKLKSGDKVKWYLVKF